MDIFGVGSSELFLILLLASIVLGPRRMIRVARDLGRFIHDLRQYYEALAGNLNQELAALAEFDEANPIQAVADSIESATASPAFLDQEWTEGVKPDNANPGQTDAGLSEPGAT